MEDILDGAYNTQESIYFVDPETFDPSRFQGTGPAPTHNTFWLMRLLETLYDLASRRSNQIYMVLVILLILSQDSSFNAGVHKLVLPTVPWYKERLIHNSSLGSLMVNQIHDSLAIMGDNSTAFSLPQVWVALLHSTESGVGSPKKGAEHDSAATLPIDQVVEHAGKQVGKSSTITAALASAGHVLDGTDSELVLNPLRLAFDTKKLKL